LRRRLVVEKRNLLKDSAAPQRRTALVGIWSGIVGLRLGGRVLFRLGRRLVGFRRLRRGLRGLGRRFAGRVLWSLCGFLAVRRRVRRGVVSGIGVRRRTRCFVGSGGGGVVRAQVRQHRAVGGRGPFRLLRRHVRGGGVVLL